MLKKHEINFVLIELSKIKNICKEKTDIIRRKIKQICILNQIYLEKDLMVTMCKNIKKYGINIIKIPIKDVMTMEGKKVSKRDLEIFSEPFQENEKDYFTRYDDMYFNRRGIGSQSQLFYQHNPKTVKSWAKIVDKTRGIKIKRQRDIVIDKEYQKISRYASYVNVNNMIKDMDDYLYKFLIIKGFFGFALQNAILKIVSEEVGMPYEIGTDKQDGKGIDAIFFGKKRNIEVNVKPVTFYHSDGEKHFNKNIAIINYEKKENDIIITYENLLRKAK